MRPKRWEIHTRKQTQSQHTHDHKKKKHHAQVQKFVEEVLVANDIHSVHQLVISEIRYMKNYVMLSHYGPHGVLVEAAKMELRAMADNMPSPIGGQPPVTETRPGSSDDSANPPVGEGVGIE